MPNFRFEAMDSTGETQTDQVQAANAEEAMSMLRASGLFVTVLTEVTQSTDNESMSAQPRSVASTGVGAVTRQPRHGRSWGRLVTAIGLICAAFGLYGVIDSLLCGIGAQRVKATVVAVGHTADVPFDVLEFTASGRQYRVDARGSFGVIWGPSHGLRSRVSVLCVPDRPEDARLAAFVPRFAIPLILLALGCMFTPAGYLILQKGNAPRFVKVIYLAVFVAIGMTGAILAIVAAFKR